MGRRFRESWLPHWRRPLQCLECPITTRLESNHNNFCAAASRPSHNSYPISRLPSQRSFIWCARCSNGAVLWSAHVDDKFCPSIPSFCASTAKAPTSKPRREKSNISSRDLRCRCRAQGQRQWAASYACNVTKHRLCLSLVHHMCTASLPEFSTFKVAIARRPTGPMNS